MKPKMDHIETINGEKFAVFNVSCGRALCSLDYRKHISISWSRQDGVKPCMGIIGADCECGEGHLYLVGLDLNNTLHISYTPAIYKAAVEYHEKKITWQEFTAICVAELPAPEE